MTLEYTKEYIVPSDWETGDALDIPFTFDYLDEADIKVYKTDTTTTPLQFVTAWSFKNRQEISLVESQVGSITAGTTKFLINRETVVEDPYVTFAPGSAVRAEDLNNNQKQALYSAQEREDRNIISTGDSMTGPLSMGGNKITNLSVDYGDNADADADHEAASKGWVREYYHDVDAETLKLSDGRNWVQSTDGYVATTGRTSQYVGEALKTALNDNVNVENGLTHSANDPVDGQITLGIGQGSVDLDRIKPEDIVNTSEANSDNIIINDSPADNPEPSGYLDDDSRIPTVGAVAHWFENFVQTNTPEHPEGSGKEFRKGQFHFAAENDNTLSIYNGSTWVPVVAGVKDFLKQEQLIWVDSESGSDNNDGHRVVDPMKTIKAAVASAKHGDMILVQPGVYREICPIDLGSKKNVSIIGLSMRSVFVHPTPNTETAGMFKCGSGCFIANMTLSGVKASGTRTNLATGDNSSEATTQGWYFQFSSSAGPVEADGGASIDSPNELVRFTKSPYIQNVTAFADSNILNHTRAEYELDNSLGGFFDPHKTNLDPQDRGFGGDLSSGITGGGLLVDGNTPHPDSPLRSFLTDAYTLICLDGPGVLVRNEGYAQLVSTFGHFCHYHAKVESGGMINMSNCTTDFGRFGLIADGKSTSSIFSSTALVAKQGSGKTVHLSAGSTGWRGQTSPAPADHMVATREVDGVTTVYNIDSVEKLEPGDADHTGSTSQNEYKVTFATDPGEVSVTNIFYFYLRSTITTGGHVFEFAGSGTDYRAHPDNGGIPVEDNQVQNLNDGKVYISSSDHNGKFKVGDVFSVDSDGESVTVNGSASISGEVTASGDVTVDGTLDTQSLTINGSPVNTSATYFDISGVILDDAMPDKVTAGEFSYPDSVTVDIKGRVTAISAGTEPVTAVNVTSPITGDSNSKTPTIGVKEFGATETVDGNPVTILKGVVSADSEDSGKFLKGDGSWSDVTSSVGLSAAADGSNANLVLERTAGNDTVKFAAGTGIDITVSGSSGSEQILIEAPTRVNAQVHIRDTVPTSGVAHGDLYFDFATGESYLYYNESLAIDSSTNQAVGSDAYWIQFAPQQRGTGNGTVTSIQVTGGTGLSVDNLSAVVTSGSYQVSLDDTENDLTNPDDNDQPQTYGSASKVTTFKIDRQGRFTEAGEVDIDLNASAVSDGEFDLARIPLLTVNKIPQFNAEKIQYTNNSTEINAWDSTAQEFITDVIPDLDPSKIKYDVNGTPTSIWDATNNDLEVAVIPNLTPSKIPYVANNHLTFNAKQIPDLSSSVSYYTDPDNINGTTVSVHGYLKDIVQDTTPELGGNLQVTKEFEVSGTTTYTNYEIQSKDNNNIILKPDGTGVVSFANNTGTTYVNGDFGVTIKPPTLEANHNLVLPGFSVTFPAADGAQNQYLKTDGSGNLGWGTDNTATSWRSSESTRTAGLVPATAGSGDASKYLAGDGNWTTLPTPSSFESGMIMWWPGLGDNIPSGWLECDGRVLFHTAYAEETHTLYENLRDALANVQGTSGCIYDNQRGRIDEDFPEGTSLTTFNNLYQFALPDLRGEFIRGWDHGRERDTEENRELGSVQDDQFQGHAHSASSTATTTATGNGPGQDVPVGTQRAGVAQKDGSTGSVSVTTTIGAPTTNGTFGDPLYGNETRPRNIALIAIIKT